MKLFLFRVLFAVGLFQASVVIASAENYTVLRSFGVLTNIGGFNPRSPLIEGPDGMLYGTTYTGESIVTGTIFKVDTNGANFTVLKCFTNESPDISGKMALAGNTLYGTTENSARSEERR